MVNTSPPGLSEPTLDCQLQYVEASASMGSLTSTSPSVTAGSATAKRMEVPLLSGSAGMKRSRSFGPGALGTCRVNCPSEPVTAESRYSYLLVAASYT